MTTLLHIDSSIQGERSVTRELTTAIVADLRPKRPDLQVHYRNLATRPLTHLMLDLLPSDNPLAGVGAGGAGVGGPDDRHSRLASEEALDAFLAADVVVIGAPMYNFTLPSQLKAWIDRILIAGKTFSYSAAGPTGLAGAKRVIVAISRGNFYDAEHSAAEHLESYLRSVFGFIGVTDLEFIAADGVQVGPEHRERALKGALETAGQLRAA
jgi:FMN-dependent NADH-azoreductase